MKSICKVKHGSHLYGLNTEKSDTDLKGVFLPEVKDLLLGKDMSHISKKTNTTELKNDHTDVDFESFSIQRFMHLLETGQPMAIEVLFTPPEHTLETSIIWEKITSVRHQLLTKSCKAFTGYCISQASKYCVKGDRLETLEKCLSILKEFKPTLSINYYFKELVVGMGSYEHFKVLEVDTKHGISFSILGKKFFGTARIMTVTESLESTLNRYGNRTRTTKEMGGADWKALSHALRIAVEVKEILTEGTLTLPLKKDERNFIFRTKQGLVKEDVVVKALETLLNEVEEAQKTSTLPEKFNKNLAEELILSAYNA